MDIVLQLDSNDFGDLYLSFYFSGVLYVFKCDRCRVTGYFNQTS